MTKFWFKSLYLKGYTTKRSTYGFPEKSWTKRGVNKLLKKLRDKGTVDKRPGSGGAVPALMKTLSFFFRSSRSLPLSLFCRLWGEATENTFSSAKKTRHRASTSMYSLTFCVRFLLRERHQRKPAVQAAAVMLRTPPVDGQSPASQPRPLPIYGAQFW